MKREELKALELSDEAIDAIMKLHGKDVETHKSQLVEAEKQAQGLQGQLDEATKAIDGFKGMDVDGIKAAADEWKAKAEQAKVESTAAIQKLKFEHALDGALAQAKAKNAKAVKALLDPNGLKLNETDGTLVGLAEQLEKVKSENDYLFDSEKELPKIVAGASGKSVNLDSVAVAARKAAGLSTE